jgi:hypothetical protein
MIQNPSPRRRTKRRSLALLYLLPALVAGLFTIFLGPSVALASNGNTGFGFNAPQVAGAPTGSVFLTGGGAFNLSTGFVHSAGGFRCTSGVSQGPLSGCSAGQGVRWDTASLLPSTVFTCTGETEPTARTADSTVVLLADFYRAGDGNDESFTAKMIVSADDFAPNDPGVQNVWVQGVGCGTATVHFSS